MSKYSKQVLFPEERQSQRRGKAEFQIAGTVWEKESHSSTSLHYRCHRQTDRESATSPDACENITPKAGFTRYDKLYRFIGQINCNDLMMIDRVFTRNDWSSNIFSFHEAAMEETLMRTAILTCLMGVNAVDSSHGGRIEGDPASYIE